MPGNPSERVTVGIVCALVVHHGSYLQYRSLARAKECAFVTAYIKGLEKAHLEVYRAQ
ncbi:hypothetical protein Pmar_PMAR008951 [Perkinsus marinus ATCC 50983]|uniref:Uncharacterized protein n=1 Tax=Perkinsus marinus (strain ATCC 50983 / TXsc) TaxID=423536 RepID=C5LM39_PERM5|nr:hypothetical protein Pmar_PMAR008951 [Perkinsus marinus ATCC 50983]EER02170.1 hypothetical protein Pmar_PMAR008951 [Perkinsus marinus ATCC 50983]|eukprot:XP_002769452.1 hypothetical protein Pmar_PMAR008951 [Perkinsus marinus ATCC 50983]